MDFKYEDFIKGINNRNGIKQIDFYVEGYSHYNSCSIGRYIDKMKYKDRVAVVDARIQCILTKDHKEDVAFLYTFREDYKLFNFQKKGKFTLKDIWDRIVITKVTYFQND